MGALAIALLIGATLYLGAKAETRRANRLARERRQHVAFMAEIGYTKAVADPDEPRDAIPAGYPGYKGSIRLIHYGPNDAEENWHG
jgi:hypothetical protein